jgi:two-component system, chemotaxis family, chemotaxis protein CheY
MVRILVVDDDEAIREVVEDSLTDEGHQVRTAEHGRAALDLLDNGYQPELILVDLLMPVMDGWALIEALQGRGIRVPYVLLAANPDLEQWARELRAANWIQKPFDLSTLFSCVRRVTRA